MEDSSVVAAARSLAQQFAGRQNSIHKEGFDEREYRFRKWLLEEVRNGWTIPELRQHLAEEMARVGKGTWWYSREFLDRVCPMPFKKREAMPAPRPMIRRRGHVIPPSPPSEPIVDRPPTVEQALNLIPVNLERLPPHLADVARKSLRRVLHRMGEALRDQVVRAMLPGQREWWDAAGAWAPAPAAPATAAAGAPDPADPFAS